MRFIPKNPTLAEIVAQQYGNLENYLNDAFQKDANNGYGYTMIMEFMDISLAAVIEKTGRNRRTVMSWQAIRDEEAKQNAK